MIAAPRRRAAFWGAMALGLAVRLAILSQTSGLGATITDEQHYAAIASNILERGTFAAADGLPTSIRPPLYPALVAGIWSVTSLGNLQAVRGVQIALSALTVWCVFLLGQTVFTRRAGAIAAAIVWLYPSLIFFNSTLLTETLFTLLLVLFLTLAVRLVTHEGPGRSIVRSSDRSIVRSSDRSIVRSSDRPTLVAIACGVTLGLATLTRSVLWPLPLILCPFLALAIPGTWRARLGLPLLVFVAFAVTLAPWAVRNTRLQGVPTLVDTMGGINLRMGNYAHTPDDRMWDVVSLRGEKNWVYGIGADIDHMPTEGEKDKWAQRKAVDYMRAHPGITLRRAAIKFADFWGLEREFVAGVQNRLFAPPTWFVWMAAALTVVACVLVMLSGAAGLWLAAPRWRAHTVLLLPALAITAAHTIVFGHSRYHIPLIPILALYASALVADWPRRVRPSSVAWLGAGLTTLLLAGIWMRELLFVEGPRLRAFWDSLMS